MRTTSPKISTGILCPSVVRLNNSVLARFLAVPLVLFSCCAAVAQSSANAPAHLRVTVQGDTSRLPDFVQNMRREFAENGMIVEFVDRGREYDYNLVIAQESSIGGAAAAVIVMDSACGFVTSVVRSGRWSGKGAFNATAKELAKKIAMLKGM